MIRIEKAEQYLDDRHNCLIAMRKELMTKLSTNLSTIDQDYLYRIERESERLELLSQQIDTGVARGKCSRCKCDCIQIHHYKTCSDCRFYNRYTRAR